jgi:hypothetical protein
MGSRLAFTPFVAGIHPLRQAWDEVVPDQLWWATAFASQAGVTQLRRLLPRGALAPTQKRWLAGIHRGVTHPEALDTLRRLARSDVRVPFGEQTLAAPGLMPSDVFHPKVCCLVNRRSGAAAVVSTSGNLTQGGLVGNVEQWLTWSGTVDDDELGAFIRWWAPLWAAADVASEDFIARYAAARPRLPVSRQSPEPADAELRRASWLWVELVRPPSGESFNQLELMLNAHAFFFPRGQPSGERRLTFEDARGAVFDAPGRKVRYHGGLAGNHMWRVYLPTHHEGLRGYQDGDVLVRFTRTPTRDRYRIDLMPARSPAALGWLRAGKVASPASRPPRRMGWG